MSRYARDRDLGIEDQAVRLPYADPELADDMATDAERWLLGLYGVADQVREDEPTPCDYVSRNRYGKRVHLDIKSTPYTGDSVRLIRHRDARKRTHWCTAYVLVTGKPGSWKVIGWTWGFILRKHWDTTLPKAAWAMKREDLKSPESFDIFMAASFGLTRRR